MRCYLYKTTTITVASIQKPARARATSEDGNVEPTMVGPLTNCPNAPPMVKATFKPQCTNLLAGDGEAEGVSAVAASESAFKTGLKEDEMSRGAQGL